MFEEFDGQDEMVRVLPPGLWVQDPSHYPGPPSPLHASFKLRLTTDATREAAEYWGLPISEVRYVLHRGWVYNSIRPIEELAASALSGGHDWSVAARIARSVECVRADEVSRCADRWTNLWKPSLEEEGSRLARMELRELSDTALGTHLAATLAFARTALRVHYAYLALPFAVTMRRLLALAGSEDFSRVQTLLHRLGGISRTVTEPERRLNGLADRVRHSPKLRELLKPPSTPSLGALGRLDPVFGGELRAFIRDFGPRSTAFDVAAPTLSETLPQLMIRIYELSFSGPGGSASVVTKAANSSLPDRAGTPSVIEWAPNSSPELRRALKRAAVWYPIRDDNVLSTQSLADGLVHLACRELGRRLADTGRLLRPDDGFLLTLSELSSAVAGPPSDLQGVVRDRAKMLEAQGRRRPPAVIGSQLEFAVGTELPSETRYLMDTLLWALQPVFFGEPGTPGANGDELRGIPASAGVAIGPARVIQDVSEFSTLRPGEIVVCRSAFPAWSAFLPKAIGLVTDFGGMLTHAAILARELHIPAVLGAERATMQIHTGDIIEVDGGVGSVTITHRATDP